MLRKSPTGISGLDEVTGGGLPTGRSTLICGPAGCGETLLAMEFLVRGLTEYGEPGVFVAFEETTDDLVANFASLGFDLPVAEAAGLLVLDHVKVVRSEVEETGDWDLDGLRSELHRLFAWLKDRGVTAVISFPVYGAADPVTARQEDTSVPWRPVFGAGAVLALLVAAAWTIRRQRCPRRVRWMRGP